MRLRSVIAFGIGYMVGTRAGRERYKELVDAGRGVSETLRELASSPVAQDVLGKVRGTLGLAPPADGGEQAGDEQSERPPRVEVVSEPERQKEG